MNETKIKNNLVSSSKVAALLGMSRVTIFRKIKSGEIKAIKIGRNYAIPLDQFSNWTELTDERKKKIEQIVKRAVDEYGETFRLLGRE